LLALGALAVAVTAGCALVTDVGTKGFVLTDAGTSECQSASDCDGGALCCVTSLSPMTTSCAATCPTVPFGVDVQFCATNGECGNSTCIEQVCSGATIHACGLVSVCSAAGISVDASAAPDTALPPPLDASAGLHD
jgi:hypothetical protein